MTDKKVISDLCQKAIDMRSESYAPYSDFLVGSAVLLGDGSVYTGCNIENSAFGPSICAERTAIFKAVSEGIKDFEAIAVAGGPEDSNGRPVLDDFCPPCGICRQVLREFAPELRVLVIDSQGHTDSKTLKELLPESFGPSDLL